MSSAKSFGSVLAFAGLLAGCASARPAAMAQPSPLPEAAPVLADLPPLEGQSAPAPALATRRRVGDLVVHRFHGSYSKQALVLTERVSAVEGDLLVVDYELAQGDRSDKLRVRMSARSERVIAVSRWDGRTEEPAEIADYESLLARTSFVPDQNAGRMAEGAEICLVGPDEFACSVNKYKVFVGEREAALTVRSSDQLGRDLSGEIVALDGTIVYSAELVELRRGPEAPPATGNASASLERR